MPGVIAIQFGIVALRRCRLAVVWPFRLHAGSCLRLIDVLQGTVPHKLVHVEILANNFVGSGGNELTCSKSLYDVLWWSKGLLEAKPIIKIIIFVM